jgi:hypothetical protein
MTVAMEVMTVAMKFQEGGYRSHARIDSWRPWKSKKGGMKVQEVAMESRMVITEVQYDNHGNQGGHGSQGWPWNSGRWPWNSESACAHRLTIHLPKTLIFS